MILANLRLYFGVIVRFGFFVEQLFEVGFLDRIYSLKENLNCKENILNHYSRKYSQRFITVSIKAGSKKVSNQCILSEKSPRVDLKLKHYEKVTKFEKISHLFWQNSSFPEVVSKKMGYFFKFLWPFQKSWTLRWYDGRLPQIDFQCIHSLLI